MKVFLLYIFGLLCIIKIDAQTATKNYGKIAVTITKEKKRKGPIYCKVEILQPFTVGDSAWVQKTEKDINRQLLFLRKIKKGDYLVLVHMVVDKYGDLSDVKPLSNVGYGMEDIVMRVLRVGPFWRPALQLEGRQVKPYRTSIITMPLSDDN